MTRDKDSLNYKLPARVEVQGIDDAMSSLKDLAGRRDALMQMAEQAKREAGAIEKEIEQKIQEFNRQLMVSRAEMLSR